MSAFGIRSRLKSGIKRALGRDDSPPSPPATAPRPPAQRAAPATPEVPAATAPPVAVAPEPVAAPTPQPVPAPTPEPAAASTSTMDPTDDTAGPALTFEAVQEILDDMVRPALQGDGGDITLLKVDGDNIHVKLVGACSTCPSSIMTMKMGVEALLREEFPTMKELVQEDAMDMPA